MKIFKSVLVGLLALVNNFFALGIVDSLSKGNTMGVFGCAVVIVICSFLITLLRKAMPFIIPAICEVILSPLSFIRYLLGIILLIVTKSEFALDLDDMDYSEDIPSTITTFLVYHAINEADERSVVSNFFVQLLIVLPISFLMSGCIWLFFIKSFFEKYGVLGYIALIIVFLTLLMTMASMKTSDIDIYVPERTFFINSRTNSSYSKHGNYSVTKKGSDAGWIAINQSSGYVIGKGHMIMYVIILAIFSPILVFTQAFGTIMAFVAIFTRHIYSSTGEILLKDVPLKILQAPFAILCSFVFC